MTTIRWWHGPTRMASAVQFGRCILYGFGLFSVVMSVVVGYESADWKAIDILGPVFFAVFFCALLTRLFGWNDLANKFLGPPLNSNDARRFRRNWRRAYLAFLVAMLLLAYLIRRMGWFVEWIPDAINIGAGVLLLAWLAQLLASRAVRAPHLIGWRDLATKVLGPPSNSDDRK